MITQIPKMISLYLFGCELAAIPRGNAVLCGASYHVKDLPSVIICDDVAKDPSDCLSPLTSVTISVDDVWGLRSLIDLAFTANTMMAIRSRGRLIANDLSSGCEPATYS